MHIKIYQINGERDKNVARYRSLEELKQIGQNPQIESSIYDEVFDGHVDCKSLDDIYLLFNSEYHPLYRGGKMSISDVISVIGDVPCLVGKIKFYNSKTAFEECVYISEEDFNRDIEAARDVGRTIEIEDLRGKGIPCVEVGSYYNEPSEFIPVSFDMQKAHKPDNLLCIVYIEPNKPPFEAEVEKTLDGMQKAVKGPIEIIDSDDKNVGYICNEESKYFGMAGNRRIGDGSYIIAGPFFVCGLTANGYRGLTDEESAKYMEKFKEPEQISPEETQGNIGYVLTEWNF